MPVCKNDSSKRYTPGTRTPQGLGFCATAEKAGTRKRGGDGRMYKVKQVSKGAMSRRWVLDSATKPKAKPATKPKAKPATKPATKPKTKQTKPVAKPATKPKAKAKPTAATVLLEKSRSMKSGTVKSKHVLLPVSSARDKHWFPVGPRVPAATKEDRENAAKAREYFEKNFQKSGKQFQKKFTLTFSDVKQIREGKMSALVAEPQRYTKIRPLRNIDQEFKRVIDGDDIGVFFRGGGYPNPERSAVTGTGADPWVVLRKVRA